LAVVVVIISWLRCNHLGFCNYFGYFSFLVAGLQYLHADVLHFHLDVANSFGRWVNSVFSTKTCVFLFTCTLRIWTLETDIKTKTVCYIQCSDANQCTVPSSVRNMEQNIFNSLSFEFWSLYHNKIKSSMQMKPPNHLYLKIENTNFLKK
jgi:hypothetical protein